MFGCLVSTCIYKSLKPTSKPPSAWGSKPPRCSNHRNRQIPAGILSLGSIGRSGSKEKHAKTKILQLWNDLRVSLGDSWTLRIVLAELSVASFRIRTTAVSGWFLGVLARHPSHPFLSIPHHILQLRPHADMPDFPEDWLLGLLGPGVFASPSLSLRRLRFQKDPKVPQRPPHPDFSLVGMRLVLRHRRCGLSHGSSWSHPGNS